MSWKFNNPTEVTLRNGEKAFVSRKGYISSNIVVGIYKEKPFCWFANGFYRLDGSDKVDNHREFDIMS